jgi:hypothetical protein
MTTRSRRAGPKNQLVNTSQTPVAITHFAILLPVLVLGGLVDHRKKNAAEVQPHAVFMR